jgi:ABC-type multidrug transport system ATPase subunit
LALRRSDWGRRCKKVFASVRRRVSPPKAATSLGVVTQDNALWDKLTCADHLRTFAALRGVPRAEVGEVVAKTLAALELTPHADKLSMRLSGGMKVSIIWRSNDGVSYREYCLP